MSPLKSVGHSQIHSWSSNSYRLFIQQNLRIRSNEQGQMNMQIERLDHKTRDVIQHEWGFLKGNTRTMLHLIP